MFAPAGKIAMLFARSLRQGEGDIGGIKLSPALVVGLWMMVLLLREQSPLGRACFVRSRALEGGEEWHLGFKFEDSQTQRLSM